MTYVYGDPLALQFTGINAGEVKITNFVTNTASVPTSPVLTATSKGNLTFSDLYFESGTGGGVSLSITDNVLLQRCAFITSRTGSNSALNITSGVITTGLTITKCIFVGSNVACNIDPTVTSGQSVNVTISDCLVHSFTSWGIVAFNGASANGTGVKIYNCTAQGGNTGFGLRGTNSNSGSIYNSLAIGLNTGLSVAGSNVNTQDFNRFVNCVTGISGSAAGGTNTSTAGIYGVDFGYGTIVGLNPVQMFATQSGSPNTSFGTSTNAPVNDMYGVTWSGTSPDAGSATYRNIGQVGVYLATERNASTITIAPGSTSQSIELYLGATGLTASTAGLSARYNRTRTASVSIPLVARTIAQAWTSGGFAEVDATNMPGVYRLDIPDAALAAGADDVTIVVRGASGTNGAVMTVKLSSGGLTSAQTAAAVWDAATASYTNNGSFGLNVLRADQQNKAGNVTLHSSGNVNRVDADVHAIANDADAATELKGALLHNGTDYISAELLSPVSAATSVHIGPYQLLADGLGADQPLDVNVGTATSIDVQVTDANGTGIDITGATVSAKVYNSGGTLVATYNGTATYADNGRLSFGLTTTVTATSGTYTVTVTRTTGASDTQVFGPLKLYVRPV
jgi:hypothetical protein